MEKEDYMKIAIELAKKARGNTNPNPMVGAVIVKNGKMIGQGYHEYCGGLHAERNALAACQEDPANSDLYVTLEPCCHYGRTPPCTEAILEAKIARVFIGSRDPNPLVAGKGITTLKKGGVQVEADILKEECDGLNEIYFHYISHKMPYVIMKYAMTADGKIATQTGDSKWITGESARRQVHEIRNGLMGIMVGIGTVFTDDPMLNCRIEGGKNPIRIICDSSLRIPTTSNVVKTAKEIHTIVAAVQRNKTKEQELAAAGVELIFTPSADGKVDLTFLMKELGKRNIDSILLEGGGALNYSALQAGLVTRIQAYVAPKIFGGEKAKSPVRGEGVMLAADAFGLKLRHISQIGEDILLEYDVGKEEG